MSPDPSATRDALPYDPHDPPMMRCGHAANAHRNHADGTKTPVCAMCLGIGDLGGDEVMPERPSLEGREMKCTYLRTRNGREHTPMPSRWNAAFFEHRPDDDYDRYYCGCYGWG